MINEDWIKLDGLVAVIKVGIEYYIISVEISLCDIVYGVVLVFVCGMNIFVENVVIGFVGVNNLQVQIVGFLFVDWIFGVDLDVQYDFIVGLDVVDNWNCYLRLLGFIDLVVYGDFQCSFVWCGG